MTAETVFSEKQLQAIEDEWYVVRYSGETPEISFNSAIYHLTRAKEGPGVKLTEQQIDLLKQAAVDRFSEIVLRDLDHENCDKSIYRGIERSIVNYHRFAKFCLRQQLEVDKVRGQAAVALRVFLDKELQLAQKSERPSIINCTLQDLENFAYELGVELVEAHRTLGYFEK